MKQRTRRRTEISIETHEVKTLRIHRKTLGFCRYCGAETREIFDEGSETGSPDRPSLTTRETEEFQAKTPNEAERKNENQK